MIAVHVAQLLKAPVGTTRTYEFSETEPALEAELGVEGLIEGEVKLTRTSHGILVDCAYVARLNQECGRCLGPARTVIDNQFSQEFLPSIDIHTGLPDDLVADPDEPRIRPDHLVDLTEAIRQDIVVEQPLQPLCRPDCAGLCSVCGQNLNEAQCGHEPSDEGEGLSRLGELLETKLKVQSSRFNEDQP